MIESQSANVVVVPANARVELFQQIWLSKHGVISEASSGIFTPVAVQCADESVDVLILPNRVQIAGRGSVEESIELATRRMVLLLQNASSAVMPIQGCGLNFNFVVTGETARDVLHSIEELFFKSNTFLAGFSTDRKFGLSVVEEQGATKVTTKVEHVTHAELGKSGVMLDLNFHRAATSIEDVESFVAEAGSLAAIARNRVDVLHSEILPGT